MFKSVAGRPYPPTGLTTKLWMQIKPQTVLIANLHATQEQLSINSLLETSEGESWSGDTVCHVVAWRGELYLEDGHHRAVRQMLAGRKYLLCRVFDNNNPT